jgi:hypothetical protein
MFAMDFGTLDQALAAARRLHRRHAAITGVMPRAAGPYAAGSRYRANEASALLWVHATLIETGRWSPAISSFHRFRPRIGSVITPKAGCSRGFSGFRKPICHRTGRTLPHTTMRCGNPRR